MRGSERKAVLTVVEEIMGRVGDLPQIKEDDFRNLVEYSGIVAPDLVDPVVQTYFDNLPFRHLPPGTQYHR